MWLSGLFNPMAFLTAIMQITARQTSLPLDNMTTETHITTMNAPEEVTEYPESGAYVHGLFIEGARWAVGEEAGEPMVLGSTAVAGHLVDSRLKELLPALPLVYVRAVPVDPQWEPSDVGYLRHDPAVYECPIYTTTFRGPTYVTLATLKTLDPVSKWVRAGVAIVMQEDD
jgi:dynein heavy chain